MCPATEQPWRLTPAGNGLDRRPPRPRRLTAADFRRWWVSVPGRGILSVHGRTASEARAAARRILALDGLPPGTEVERK